MTAKIETPCYFLEIRSAAVQLVGFVTASQWSTLRELMDSGCSAMLTRTNPKGVQSMLIHPLREGMSVSVQVAVGADGRVHYPMHAVRAADGTLSPLPPGAEVPQGAVSASPTSFPALFWAVDAPPWATGREDAQVLADPKESAVVEDDAVDAEPPAESDLP